MLLKVFQISEVSLRKPKIDINHNHHLIIFRISPNILKIILKMRYGKIINFQSSLNQLLILNELLNGQYWRWLHRVVKEYVAMLAIPRPEYVKVWDNSYYFIQNQLINWYKWISSYLNEFVSYFFVMLAHIQNYRLMFVRNHLVDHLHLSMEHVLYVEAQWMVLFNE